MAGGFRGDRHRLPRPLVKTFASGTVPRAVDGVSLTIRSNEFFTLLRPERAAGKDHHACASIAGFRDSGFRLDPACTAESPRRAAALSPAGPIRYSRAMRFFPHLTVAENVRLRASRCAARRFGAPRSRAKVKEMLALVKLDGLDQRKPAQLSGGQQQARRAGAGARQRAARAAARRGRSRRSTSKLRTGMQLEAEAPAG